MFEIKDGLCVTCRDVDWIALFKGGINATAPHHSRFGDVVHAAVGGCRLCSLIVAKFNEQRAKAATVGGHATETDRELELSLDLRKSIYFISTHHLIVDLKVHFQDKDKGFR